MGDFLVAAVGVVDLVADKWIICYLAKKYGIMFI